MVCENKPHIFKEIYLLLSISLLHLLYSILLHFFNFKLSPMAYFLVFHFNIFKVSIFSLYNVVFLTLFNFIKFSFFYSTSNYPSKTFYTSSSDSQPFFFSFLNVHVFSPSIPFLVEGPFSQRLRLMDFSLLFFFFFWIFLLYFLSLI